jgi:ribosomal protein L35AE/L33A
MGKVKNYLWEIAEKKADAIAKKIKKRKISFDTGVNDLLKSKVWLSLLGIEDRQDAYQYLFERVYLDK